MLSRRLTKTGFVFVFDRVTGRPLWPIEERAVAKSDVPGERAAATQPFPTKPAPFAVQGFTTNDVIDFTPEIKARALETVSHLRLGPLFTPPSMEGTVVSPRCHRRGGMGEAVRLTQPPVCFTSRRRTSQRSTRSTRPRAAIRWMRRTARISGSRDFASHSPIPRVGACRRCPSTSLPCRTLTAIDLNSGDQLWHVVFGDTPGVHNHPLLKNLNLPPLGVAGSPGPIVTAGGLLFLSGGGAAALCNRHKEWSGALVCTILARTRIRCR